jgi:acetylornithine/succinyldiaminopimelate/putrescine aminotransferase
MEQADVVPHIFLDFMQMQEFAKDPLVFVGGEGIRPFPPHVRPGKIVERAARERGLLLRCGNDFAALAPPLVITTQGIDEICGILGESIGVAQEELLGGVAAR